MKWYYVFIKSLREQFRDYWILVLTLVFAPFFVFMYYLMSETETPSFKVIFVNQDKTENFSGIPVNLGDTLIHYLQVYAGHEESVNLRYRKTGGRETGLQVRVNRPCLNWWGM